WSQVPPPEARGARRQIPRRRRSAADTMVDRECQRGDRAHRGHAVLRYYTVGHPPHREDCGLGRVHDCGETVDAHGPKVRDGEDGPRQLVLGKLAHTGVLLEPLAFRSELLEPLAVGVAENRDEQTVLERDREADVR